MTTHTPKLLRAALAALACVCSLFTTLAAAGDEVKKTFDIEAGDALPALKQFATQSGGQLLYSAEAVEGVTTNAVKGTLTAREALDRMVAGTKLAVVADKKNGALSLVRANRPNAQRVVPEVAATPINRGKVEGATVVLDRFQVVDTKVDGLNNKGLLQNGIDGALYHDVVTRADIERMGVTSIEELFRLMPATSSPQTFFQTNDITGRISGGTSTRFSTMGVRGFDSTQTVILINGRALPRSAEIFGADLSRIPLSAIERVEVMPYAGSAIYGAGAIGGAINIILRKNYSGQEMTIYAGTTTGGGAGEYRVSFLDGRAFADGRGRLTTTLMHQHRDPLRAGQRNYLARAAARFNPNNRSVLDGSGRTYFETFLLPAIAASPATIVVGNAPTAAINDLGIPGVPGARWAVVPDGTSASSSLAITPASFSATAGQAAPLSQDSRYNRLVLYEPIDSYSANAQVEYDFLKQGRLSGYGELTYGFNRKDYSFPQASSVTLSATDPLNPFRANVTPGFAGRPVTVYLSTPDIDEPRTVWEYESARGVLGLKGKITDRFEWSVDGVIDYAHNTVFSDNPPQNMLTLSALTVTGVGTSPAAAAVRRAVYPLLSDHIQFPISAQTNDDYFSSIRYTTTRSVQKEGNARVTGDLFELPAGPLRASIFGKYQQWTNTSGQIARNVPGYTQLIYGTNPFPEDPSSSERSRKTWQSAAEVSMPVIGEKWRPVPIDSIELQASFSTEESTTMRPDAKDNVQRGNTRVLAGKIQPVKDVAFRASYSQGFFPPNWSAVLSAPASSFFPFGIAADALRGNTVQSTGFNVISGGNPDLKPERADSLNMGLILTPRFLPGFRFSFDVWQIEKTDAIFSAGLVNVFGNPSVYGSLATRAAPTPEEKAQGWAGVVTEIRSIQMNIARTETEGIDLRGRYALKTTSWGEFEFNANATFTNYFITQPIANAPEINTAGGSGPVRWRGNGSVTWNRRPWTVTLGTRYVGHFSTATTAPSSSYPNAIPYDGGRIPAYMHYDLQVTYEVPDRTGRHGWRSLLASTKWTLGVNNILDTEPDSMTGLAALGAGQSFYNAYDDPRQRFVYLSVNKRL